MLVITGCRQQYPNNLRSHRGDGVFRLRPSTAAEPSERPGSVVGVAVDVTGGTDSK
jgi:hypothetical protein